MTVEDVGNKYCGRLKEKIALLAEFSFATGKIKKVLESDEVETVASQLKVRQRIINRIKCIDKEIDGLAKHGSFSKDRLSNRGKKEIEGYLGQIKTSLKTLGELDRECLVSAQAEHDSIRSDISKLRNGIQITRGYGRTGVKHPKFLDFAR